MKFVWVKLKSIIGMFIDTRDPVEVALADINKALDAIRGMKQ